MYCVIHHISGHLPRQIWFWKFSTKTWISWIFPLLGFLNTSLNQGTHAWKERLLTMCLSNLWWGTAIIIQLAQLLSPGSITMQPPCQTVFVSIWLRLVSNQNISLEMDATSISDSIIRIDADPQMFSILHNRISKHPGACIREFEPVNKQFWTGGEYKSWCIIQMISKGSIHWS